MRVLGVWRNKIRTNSKVNVVSSFFLNIWQFSINNCIFYPEHILKQGLSKKIKCHCSQQRATMKWDTLKFAPIESSQSLGSSNRDRCTKASDMETEKCFLSYMHVVFCKDFFLFKANNPKKETKCSWTDHESLVVSITTQCVACVNINKCSQN